jgi:Rrf2 family protein
MRLELTRRGDYAIRACVLLARLGDDITSGGSIARATGIPERFVGQVMGDLVRADLVEANVGRHGGYRLARAANQISLLEIVEAVEGDTRRRTCILRGGACAAETRCSVHEFFESAQTALIERLAGAPLSEALGS